MKRWVSALVCAVLVLSLCAGALAAPTVEQLSPMLPALDSVMRSIDPDERQDYNPSDPAFVWTVLYLMGVNWGYVSDEVQVGQDPIVVPEGVMVQFLQAAFADLTELPALPGDLGIQYDQARKAYLLPGSDAGDSTSEIQGVISGDDGPLQLIVVMVDGEGDPMPGRLSAILVPRGGDGALFPYAIQSATIE